MATRSKVILDSVGKLVTGPSPFYLRPEFWTAIFSALGAVAEICDAHGKPQVAKTLHSVQDAANKDTQRNLTAIVNNKIQDLTTQIQANHANHCKDEKIDAQLDVLLDLAAQLDTLNGKKAQH